MTAWFMGWPAVVLFFGALLVGRLILRRWGP